MQSWPQGQNGDDGNNSWQENFNFGPQNGQFDQAHAWSQPVPGQNAYAGPIDPSDPTANFLPGPHTVIPGYTEGHGSFDITNQYAGQPPIDPAFSNIPSDLYTQQNKIDLAGGGMHHLNQFQGPPSTAPPSFPGNEFATFEQQARPEPQQQHTSAAPQYSQASLVPQDGRQQDHGALQPQQQFGNIQTGFAPPPLQQTPTPPIQHQQPYSQGSSFSNSQPNGQEIPYQPSPGSHPNYHQGTTAYAQPSYQPPPGAVNYDQPHSRSSAPFQPSVQQPTDVQGQAALSATSSHDGTPQPHHPTLFEHPAPSQVAEGPAKKRQRLAQPAAGSPVPDPLPSVNSPIEPLGRKVEELENIVPPTPTPEEMQMLQKFQKRTKAAQAKFPSIKGLPHLASESTIKIPAPKSYDKLAPLVALPPRSKNAIIPELGYSLPCEIQGKFTTQYRPAFDKVGLDERRIEAKPLLDEFDKSMKALGKKRPKYTEYPHSFKEQLKSDEASKNKAEKKAKKEMEEERNKPIRSATRPTDLAEAAAWDAIGIVHIDQSTPKTSTLVAGRVQQAGDFFIKLRMEMNQAKQELDQAIKDGGPELQLAELRKDAEIKKEALHRALDATIEHADDAVMDNLGGHQKLVLSLVNVLIASIKGSDFNGKLPKVVLELFTHIPMTKKIAETANFDTVRRRFADKGDEDVKGLVKVLSVRVKKALKPAEPDTATGYTGTSAASRAKTSASKTASNATSSKRGREEDGAADVRTVKKVAVESGSGGSLSKKLAQPKIQLQSASKTTAAKASASSILGDKPRPAPKLGPRPDAAGGDGPSAAAEDRAKTDAKKPAGKADAAKAHSRPEAKPPAPKMGATPSSSALSGIASLLDSINAPRAETPPAPAKEVKSPETPETEELRAKRLRKESRRQLRVSWKPEAELVQVKVFEKEDEEDEGRDMNMIRDAADDKSEGMVLKQRADVEGDEDDDDEIPYQPWLEPSATDFSDLSEERRNKNFTTRGGNVEFTTEEQGRIAQREQRELMAIYTDVDDIPPTPKSPPQEPSTAPGDLKVGSVPQEPKYEEIWLRWRDEQQLGVDGALYSATQRINAKTPSGTVDTIFGRPQAAPSMAQSSSSQGVSGSATSNATDTNIPLIMGATISEKVAAWLRSDQAKRWRDPNPIQADPNRTYTYGDPVSQAAGAAVETVVKALAGLPYPPTAPPSWLAGDEERVREWWIGQNKEASSRQKRAEEERARSAAESQPQDWTAYFAQLQQQQQQQQPQDYAPYMAILQQIQGGGQGQASAPQNTGGAGQTQMPDDQLQSILAAMGQPQYQQNPAAQGQSSNPPGYHPSDPSYQQLMMLTQMAQGQQQASGSEQARDRDPDWDRHDRDRHDRDRRHERQEDYGRGDQSRGFKDNKLKKKPGPSTIHKPPNAALIGTKPCTFWQQGKCARGDKCTFRHD